MTEFVELLVDTLDLFVPFDFPGRLLQLMNGNEIYYRSTVLNYPHVLTKTRYSKYQIHIPQD